MTTKSVKVKRTVLKVVVERGQMNLVVREDYVIDPINSKKKLKDCLLCGAKQTTSPFRVCSDCRAGKAFTRTRKISR